MTTTEARKRANARYRQRNVKSKNIAFFPDDADILNWVETRDIPAATYIKKLIREDMNKKTNNSES